jgi:LmbE family N-acetylglucosaminyl deacetylase
MELDLLAIAPHPDDVELTLPAARWVRAERRRSVAVRLLRQRE